MAAFTWVYDAPTGTYKNFTLSDDLRYAAIANAVFAAHVRPEPGFGRKKGEVVTITRVKNIPEPTSGQLQETTKIPIDPFALSTVSITVKEWGRGVEYNNLHEELSKYDITAPIQRKLRDQMKLVLDTAAALAFKAAKVVFVPTSFTGGTFYTNGAAGTQALVNLTYDHMGVIRDYLKATIHTPFYEDDNYIGIGNTKALRGIKQDPNFQQLTMYLKPGDLVYRSEVGMVENIRWIESTHSQALSGSLGAGSILGEAVIFGEDAVALAEVETPELRAAIPGDFGRQKAVAWYGILQYGIIWDTANDGEARIVHVSST